MNFRRLCFPYLIWMVIFILLPLIFMTLLAFSKTNGLSLEGLTLSLDSFFKSLEQVYVEAMFNSLFYGITASIICLLIGYPVAYYMAFSKSKYKRLFPLFVLIPSWSNMLLRILAWEMLFQPNSILNAIGVSLDLIGTPIAVLTGMVSIYLPFMIIPIYTVLSKIDAKLLEASRDLRSTKIQTFTRVVLPLSISGVFTGFIMTFLPSATAFAIPERLSGGKILLIGNIIENQFMTTSNYNFGSMISLLLVIIITVLLIVVNKTEKEGEM